MHKLSYCLWFDGKAEEAAEFYVSLLPDSKLGRIMRTPDETPGGPAGTVLSIVVDCDDQGEIDLPLIADWPNRPCQIVDHDKGKSSRTRFSVMERNHKQNSTRLELVPETGRTHQLSVHMQSIGHAILGDRLYAREDALSKSDRLMLHASHLAFPHPFTQEFLRFASEAPI